MTDYPAFGRYLRRQRELRGLSVDDVARSTKIPFTLVNALEEGEAERFPERVFMLNYVRSYATVVGVSADDALNRYEQISGVPKPEAFDPSALERIRQDKAVTAVWVLAAGAALAVVAFAYGTLGETVLRFASR